MVRVGSANSLDPATSERAGERLAFESVPADLTLDDPSIRPVQVRQVGLRDVASLRRLDCLYRLDQPHSTLKPYSLLGTGVSASVPGLRGGSPAFVAHAADRLVGFAHFKSLIPDEGWRLIALGSSVGVFEVDPVWEALLAHAVRQAGVRGVKRLHACIPRSVPSLQAFTRSGWSRYADETVMMTQRAAVSPPARSPRPQTRDDTWAIHQLYHLTVPRPVQHAEAYTSNHWDLAPGSRSRTEEQCRGWLLEEDGQLLGYARTTSRRGMHVLDLLYQPDRRDVLAALVDGALIELTGRPLRRVYCAFRGYQAEVQSALEERGFEHALHQDLLVKYTTAQVRLPAFESVPFHVEVRDKLPGRVPTFLQGTFRDGSAD